MRKIYQKRPRISIKSKTMKNQVPQSTRIFPNDFCQLFHLPSLHGTLTLGAAKQKNCFAALASPPFQHGAWRFVKKNHFSLL